MPIQVDYEQLQNSANQLRNAQREMEGQLARLKSMVEGTKIVRQQLEGR